MYIKLMRSRNRVEINSKLGLRNGKHPTLGNRHDVNPIPFNLGMVSTPTQHFGSLLVRSNTQPLIVSFISGTSPAMRAASSTTLSQLSQHIPGAGGSISPKCSSSSLRRHVSAAVAYLKIFRKACNSFPLFILDISSLAAPKNKTLRAGRPSRPARPDSCAAPMSR